MACGYAFPPINVRAVYERDGSAKSSFLAEVASMTADAGKMFRDFSNEAKTQLDSALSVKRNDLGSLDLGVAEMRQAAQAQQARAIAAREVAAATALAAKEERDYSQQARLSIAATEALAIEEERAAAQALSHVRALEQVQERLNRQASATDVVVAATRRGTSETANVINGLRAQRVAFTQLGQQLQDVTVQMQMGTSATTIFVQQVPQMAFVLSGLSESANKTQARIGKFASFLSGPWGAAIFAGTALLAPFIARLFQTGKAADESSKALEQVAFASSAVSNAQGILGGVMDITTGKINTQSAALIALARAQLVVAQIESRERQAKAGEQIQQFTGKYGPNYNAAAAKGLLQQDRPLSRLQEDLRTGKKSADDVVKSLEGMVATGQLTQGMFIDLAKAYANFGVEAENQKVFTDAQKLLDGKGGTNLLRPKTGGGSTKDTAKELQRLGEFGEDAGKKIANVRDSFRDIPPEVERINRASRELDDIISDLMTRKPEGFEQMIAQANALKAALPDAAFQQIMRQIREDSSQQVEVQKLLSQGRYAEADALQKIYQIEDRLGPLTAARKAEILAISQAQEEVNRQLERASEIQSAYLDATRSVRSEVEAILSGTGKLSNLKNVFKQLQGRIMAEQLFGDVFRDLDRWVKKETGIKDSVDVLKSETERAGSAAGAMADELAKVTSRIAGIGTGSAGYVSGPNATTSWAWPAKMSIPDAIRAPGYDKDPNPIVVEGKKDTPGKTTVTELTPQEFVRVLAQGMAVPFAKILEPLLGKKLAGNLGGVIGGVFEGQITTGTGFGAILGGLKEIKGLPGDLSTKLGDAFKGAQTGSQVTDLAGQLGLKLSKGGAEVGGAIGSFLGPVGGVFGSIAGGLLGSLFGKKVTSGYAQVRNGTVAGTYGRTDSLQNDAAESANSLVQTIASIAKTLGTKLGAYDFDIGKKNDKYVVNTGARGVSTFDTEAEAYAFAVREAVADGAFDGLSAGAKRLLQNSGDLQAQVEKALSFQNVFKSLKAFKDPVGAALDELNTEFQGLIDIFKEAGASASEYASLEELYGIRRAEAVKEANQKILGSLLDFQKSLTVGNDTLSLRDRNAAALAIYNPLAERVKAGDTTAYDDFVSASQDLLAIQRELYGSTSAFFATQDSIKAITDNAVSTQTALADSSAAADTPFAQLASQQQATTSAIDAQTAALVEALGGRLDSLNDNMIAVFKQLVANGASASDVSALIGRGYF